MRVAILGFIMVLLTIGQPAAGQQTRPSGRPSASPPPNRCSFPEQIGFAQAGVLERVAELAKQTKPVLGQISKINDKAKKPDVPIGQQLGPKDLNDFGALTQRLKTMRFLSLIESHRERDLGVIEKMTIMADQNYRFGKEVDENDPDFTIWSFLMLMRFMADGKIDNVPVEAVCGIDRALWQMENSEIEHSTIDFERMKAFPEEIRRRYKMDGKIDRERLSPQDKSRYDAYVRDIISPAERLRNFSIDIENIRRSDRVSILIYENDRHDVVVSAADEASIGATLQRRVTAGEFPDPMVATMGLWRKINEKIPAPIVTEWEQMQKALGR